MRSRSSINCPLRLSTLFALAIVSLISAGPSLAHTPIEVAKLIPINTEKYSGFGGSVAISGNTALASTVRTNDGVTKGAAYVFGRHGRKWIHEATLIPSDGVFSFRPVVVAISGRTAIIGALGSAYIFRRIDGVWTEEIKLTGSGSGFGTSVAIDGRTAVIGDTGLDAGGDGFAYVFVRVGGVWVRQATLASFDASAPPGNPWFGSSVAVSADTALIGAPTGGAYVFVRNGTEWTEQEKLVGGSQFGFGSSVALDADTAVVGDPGFGRILIPAVGQALVYTRIDSNWDRGEHLDAGAIDLGAAEVFGTSVAVAGDIAVIGAPGDDGSGAAYVFVRSNPNTVGFRQWTQHSKIRASDATEGARFGNSVALGVSTAVIGAPGNVDPFVPEIGTGSAYIFSLVPVLFDLLRQSVIGEGPERSLSDKVDVAQAHHAADDIRAACGVLSSFTDEVAAEAAQATLTDAKATELLDKALVISSELRCQRAE